MLYIHRYVYIYEFYFKNQFMILIGEKIKEKIKPSHWNAWASCFKNGYVWDVSVLDERNTVQLFAEVDWTGATGYDTDIYLNKINMWVSHYCNCTSYGRTTGCKHIAALARKIDEEYAIHSVIYFS